MLSFGPLAFTVPWVLAALVALPVLWWLLRVTPPSPKRIRFPAIRLLLRLQEKEDTPARTPWWLLLLRLAIAVLMILGLAHPLLNPDSGFSRQGPVVLVIDNGWAAGPNWDQRRDRIGSLLDQAQRDRRKVILIATARPDATTAVRASDPMVAADARARFQALAPTSWPADHAGAAKAADGLNLKGSGNIYWLSDGLSTKATARLAAALDRQGQVTLFVDSPENSPLLLHRPRLSGTKLIVNLERLAATRPALFQVVAQDDQGRAIARVNARFGRDDRIIPVTLSLPSELRNKLSVLRVEKHPGAGATLLLDDRQRRRPAGIVAPTKQTGGQPLLSDLYYLQRAIGPFTELRKGPVADLMARPLSIIFLPDSTPLSASERQRLRRWITAGGVLVRFAGPQLAQAPDALVPVRLRGGGRNFGGTMSWSKPATLAAFPKNSPFAGLTIPKEVTISRQVLAQPSADLARKTWASLSDGTPLVTADKIGDGMLILMHTTANPEWSSLALSGLFIRMLQRTMDLSRGIAAGEELKTLLRPYRVLDGLGRLRDAPGSVLPIDTTKLKDLRVSAANPPGLYGDRALRRSLNLSATVRALTPLTGLPGSFVRGTFERTSETDLKPPLLTLALILLLIDLLISFFLRGLLSRHVTDSAKATPAKPAGHKAAAGGLLLLAGLLAGLGGALTPTDPAHAQGNTGTRVDPSFVLKATKNTVLAYIKTGNGELDTVSEAALTGLGRVLRTRTAIEPAAPIGVDPETDPLNLFPVIYWPITSDQKAPSATAIAKLQDYMRTGGMLILDLRERGDGVTSDGTAALRKLAAGLKLPALVRLPDSHVLTRSYYLLQRFPGRWTGKPVWVARTGRNSKDGVSSVVIGLNDWGGAWAISRDGSPLFPVSPGGPLQREYAYRTGVNLIMYALTGNYKADQVHIPIIIKRLGQ